MPKCLTKIKGVNNFGAIFQNRWANNHWPFCAPLHGVVQGVFETLVPCRFSESQEHILVFGCLRTGAYRKPADVNLGLIDQNVITKNGENQQLFNALVG